MAGDEWREPEARVTSACDSPLTTRHSSLSPVLLLCEYSALNGAEQSLLAGLEYVLSADFAVAAAAPPDGPLAEALAQRGVEVLPFRFRDATGVPPGAEPASRRYRWAFRRPPLVVAHANSLAMARLSGPVAASRSLPSIGHVRNIVGLSSRSRRPQLPSPATGRFRGNASVPRRPGVDGRENLRALQRRGLGVLRPGRATAGSIANSGCRWEHRWQARSARFAAQRTGRALPGRDNGRRCRARVALRAGGGALLPERRGDCLRARLGCGGPGPTGLPAASHRPLRPCGAAAAGADAADPPRGRSRWGACCWRLPRPACRSLPPRLAARRRSFRRSAVPRASCRRAIRRRWPARLSN